jgi:hypothetical protein
MKNPSHRCSALPNMTMLREAALHERCPQSCRGMHAPLWFRVSKDGSRTPQRERGGRMRPTHLSPGGPVQQVAPTRWGNSVTCLSRCDSACVSIMEGLSTLAVPNTDVAHQEDQVEQPLVPTPGLRRHGAFPHATEELTRPPVIGVDNGDHRAEEALFRLSMPVRRRSGG